MNPATPEHSADRKMLERKDSTLLKDSCEDAIRRYLIQESLHFLSLCVQFFLCRE